MSPVPVFEAWLVEGKVRWKDQEGIAAYIRALEENKVGRVRITIEEDHGARSLNQNAYFHGVVNKMLAEETGFEEEEMKILLKYMFLSRYDKRGRLYVRGTHNLNRKEMSEFLERVMRWAASYLDLYIPPPTICAESYYDQTV